MELDTNVMSHMFFDRPINQYDGHFKDYTKNCGKCPYYKERDGDRCYWGVAWKKLSPTKKPRKCILIDKPSPRYLEIKERLGIEKVKSPEPVQQYKDEDK